MPSELLRSEWVHILIQIKLFLSQLFGTEVS
jgi:hypothetical protein